MPPAMRSPKGLLLLLLAVLALAYPFASSSGYHLNVLTNALFFTVLAMSLNVIYGYAGLLSFAQVGFWGVGGYVGALTVTRLGGSVWDGMLAAGAVALLLAIAISAVSLRLSNHAFVIVSIAFTLLLQLLAQEWIDVTNGPMGIPGLPAPEIVLGPLYFAFDDRTSQYFLALAFAAATLAAIGLVLSSRVGRTLRMLKHDETLARSLGVRTTRWKVFAAGFAAVVAAMAGALYVFYLSIVDPTIFDVYYTQLMLVIVIVGGLGSFWPMIAAGFVLVVLPEVLRTSDEVRMIYYGVVLIAGVLFFPRGFAGLLAARRRRHSSGGRLGQPGSI
ncbi:amino acid/amide ABC transporter membrane protein 2, HAAT family [Tistlia consotensis]|uniref:Amino acid/amide ABC transporter membrane protein 2, HAAT family n=1 Tax=Tistlia consotensis USBA 355 TaxID=560819 RepID=A0A1Y6C7R2_9PROT|nr:branched-chain amino acid ABC transporter permease [Tistlia consotensis]SMF47485.1 amino acid/amide ABC transporter membrane protein 2, HAAT family [Tistlia consotensis USBA 355]SNR82425.1 amino acid/amide ABC transporter membrane protein 2, HAAT family [Tistlia consotensis]